VAAVVGTHMLDVRSSATDLLTVLDWRKRPIDPMLDWSWCTMPVDPVRVTARPLQPSDAAVPNFLGWMLVRIKSKPEFLPPLDSLAVEESATSALHVVEVAGTEALPEPDFMSAPPRAVTKLKLCDRVRHTSSTSGPVR